MRYAYYLFLGIRGHSFTTVSTVVSCLRAKAGMISVHIILV